MHVNRSSRFVVATALTVVLAGCTGNAGSPSPAGSASAPPPSPTVASASASAAALPPAFEIDASATATSMGYSFPVATAPAGWVTITLVNSDPMLPHQAQLFRLHDGTTADAFTQALLSPAGEGAVIPLADPVGGPNAISGTNPVTGYVKLDAGATYMVLCAIPAPDGKPHYAHGMIGHFSVGQTAGAVSQPQAASTTTLTNFAFGLPTTIDWSKPIDVVNQGTQPHELVIMGAAPGKTLDDVKAALQAPPGSAPAGPPPYAFFGGVGVLAPGGHAVFQPTVPSGQYLFVCFITDPTTGKPHFAQGMINQVTVP